MAEVVSLEKERIKKILRRANGQNLFRLLSDEVRSTAELRMAVEEERSRVENPGDEGFLAGMKVALDVFEEAVSDFDVKGPVDPKSALRRFVTTSLRDHKKETAEFYRALLRGLNFGIGLIEKIIEKRFLELGKS